MARTAAVVQREFDAFKAQVVELARDAKDEHGWCDEVDRMLEQLGLEMPKRKATITIEIHDLSLYEDWVGSESMDRHDLAESIQDNLGAGTYGNVDMTVRAEIETISA